MTISIWYEDDPKTPATIQHVEFVRLIALDTIEVKCFGNGSVLHRRVKDFNINYHA